MAGALLILAGMVIMVIGAAMVSFAPKKYRRYGLIVSAIPVVWFCWNWYLHRNPYSGKGLVTEWLYGASSSYASVDAWADHNGQRVECPILLGGIREAELLFYDYDGDWRRDIVFGNSRQKQVVAFFPATSDEPPRFVVLRDDVK